MTEHKRSDLRFLKGYAYGATSLVIVLSIVAFRESQAPHFKEISAERINIVEPDGKLRMVISDAAHSPGPIAYGKAFGYPGGTRPGIIFYNDEETENGGLTFGGKREKDGTFHQTEHLSFDQYNEDQVIVLEYNDRNGKRQAGLTFVDRADVPIVELAARLDSIRKMPDGPKKTAAMQALEHPRPGEPLAAQRLFVGRDQAKDAVVTLADKLGNPRLRLRVDSLGVASLDFLDANGHVTRRISGADSAGAPSR
ncbi:MAG TPA: hypothetical protein VFW98_01750 [Gemmatimonadaceae bacterium]|nr:hypothetical protein [Gemmatimonadaceae bacterium]